LKLNAATHRSLKDRLYKAFRNYRSDSFMMLYREEKNSDMQTIQFSKSEVFL